MKQVTIKKDDWHEPSGYVVLTTRNGVQWNAVYEGTMSQCKNIMAAFKKVGFTYVSDDVRRKGGVLR